jgi:hypothetical protein
VGVISEFGKSGPRPLDGGGNIVREVIEDRPDR